MDQTTIAIIVVTWLLSVGATFFFTHIWFVAPINNKLKSMCEDTTKINVDLQTTKKVASDLRTDLTEKFSDLENRHVILNKTVGTHKQETSNIFESITEGFEFINTERSVMIKDLAELKRRVRMNSNETKRQTYQRRHRENTGSV
jgi:hypothetical protein